MTTARTRPIPRARDRILDAAERLLARFGYKKTTIEDIAREAGLGKRTLYFHVASNEAVALSSIDWIVDLLLAGLRPRQTAPNPREKSS
jgi:AcrR family transcriptional regulator